MTQNTHPLDDSDPAECYKTMMSERTELIKARREAEDNLVKTIIQLASALLLLLSGFSVQHEGVFNNLAYHAFIASILFFGVSVLSGLAEHLFSSKAYASQQDFVEKYYTKQIGTFEAPIENCWVKKLQMIQFLAFSLGLFSLSVIAIVELGADHA